MKIEAVTIKEIAEKTGLCPQWVRALLKREGIQPVARVGNTFLFDEEEAIQVCRGREPRKQRKVSLEDVEVIKHLAATGVPYDVIAQQYDISISYVSKLVSGNRIPKWRRGA